MALAFCVYHLTADVEAALQTFAQIVDYLGLSGERVRVKAEHSPGTRMALDRLGSANSLFSGMKKFIFEVASGNSLKATHNNAAPYIIYQRTAELDTMTIFSPQHTDLRSFAETFLGGVPGKYGFGIDWNMPGSFFGYAQGFEDLRSTGGDLMGESDAGGWGQFYLQNYTTAFNEPIIRDIYPVNLLTTAHLDREAGDVTVRDLISEHKEWGKITKLADNWFLWCVPSGEIDAARDAFQSRELLKNNPSGFFQHRVGK
ncbi:MAG TPA: hypothetical protein VGK90_14195 [Rhizomicrobium sp.]|jgi:hypothetical protein